MTHKCSQLPRLHRIDTGLAAADASTRKLREDVAETLEGITKELAGIGVTTKEHLDELRADFDRRFRAVFHRLDELNSLLAKRGGSK